MGAPLISDDTGVRKPRLGALKIAGLIALGLIVLCGGSLVWVGCEGRAQLRQLARETPARIAGIRARDGRRPVLYGETLPGRAWDCYAKAFTAIDAFKGNEAQRSAITEFLVNAKGDADAIDRIVAAYEPALAQLSAGAHREDGSMTLEWERGSAMDLPGLLASQNLANLASAKARRLAAQGKYREAIDTLSDLLTLGHDLAFNGVLITHMIGIAIYGMALDALVSFIAEDAFPPGDLAELARRLELADRSYPTLAHSFTNDAMMFRVTLVDETSGPGHIDGVPTVGILAADGIRKMEAYAERCARLSEKTWMEVQAQMAGMNKEAEEAWNPIVRIATPGLIGVTRSVRERLAHLRLLRTWVGARRKATEPALDDPFGGKILGAAPRFWSVARNGTDDGGNGSWKVDGPDIVLEPGKK